LKCLAICKGQILSFFLPAKLGTNVKDKNEKGILCFLFFFICQYIADFRKKKKLKKHHHFFTWILEGGIFPMRFLCEVC
jgi:hypothetical protein